MAELTVMLVTVLGGVAVAVTRKPDDSSDAFSPRCKDTSLCLLPPSRFAPSVLFFFLLPSVSLGLPIDIVDFFKVSIVSVPSLPKLLVSLSLSLPSLFCRFLPFPFFLLDTIYRGARCLLCHGVDSDGQWRRRLRGATALASHHETGDV